VVSKSPSGSIGRDKGETVSFTYHFPMDAGILLEGRRRRHCSGCEDRALAIRGYPVGRPTDLNQACGR
jgi:hypothetical protein